MDSNNYNNMIKLITSKLEKSVEYNENLIKNQIKNQIQDNNNNQEIKIEIYNNLVDNNLVGNNLENSSASGKLSTPYYPYANPNREFRDVRDVNFSNFNISKNEQFVNNSKWPNWKNLDVISCDYIKNSSSINKEEFKIYLDNSRQFLFSVEGESYKIYKIITECLQESHSNNNIEIMSKYLILLYLLIENSNCIDLVLANNHQREEFDKILNSLLIILKNI